MPLKLRIFLSSPGDVVEERQQALQVIDDLDYQSAFGEQISLEAIAWDKPGSNAPLLATATPQEAINQGLPLPSACDIVIIIFWSRMGTPLPDDYQKPDGSRYRSGTEWEYEDALRGAAENNGQPSVIIYRRDEDILLNPSETNFLEKYQQWQQVQEFFNGFVNEDGSLRQGYNTYTTPDDFAYQLRTHLANIIQRMIVEQGLEVLPDEANTADSQVSEPKLLTQLRQAARQWQLNNFSDDFLWIGKQLQSAQDLVNDLQPELDDIEQDFIRPEQERLLLEIEQPDTPHYRRAQISERLNEISDNRQGIGVSEAGLPDFMWCDVPLGEVILSTDKTELPRHELHFETAPFRMAKYQVTYSQFQAFLEAEDGYQQAEWWQGIGQHKGEPSQPRPFANHPIEFVSWYDATAFCRWASAKLGYEIRLPTEWEWLTAAGGSSLDYQFTWGAHYDENVANLRDSKLLRTTAVGMYPASASRFGVMDMTGNVWEWCVNELEVPVNMGLPNKKKRALKGCSCLTRNHKAHLGYRAGNYPNRRSEAHGFRVCTSHFD